MIKCSREIWRKFSPYQKKLFDVLNYKFNLAEYTTGIFKSKVTNEEMEKLAHNLAIVACWYIGNNCMHTSNLPARRPFSEAHRKSIKQHMKGNKNWQGKRNENPELLGPTAREDGGK